MHVCILVMYPLLLRSFDMQHHILIHLVGLVLLCPSFLQAAPQDATSGQQQQQYATPQAICNGNMMHVILSTFDNS